MVAPHTTPSLISFINRAIPPPDYSYVKVQVRALCHPVIPVKYIKGTLSSATSPYIEKNGSIEVYKLVMGDLALPSVCLLKAILALLIVHEGILDFLPRCHNKRSILDDCLVQRFSRSEYDLCVVFCRS